MMGESIWVIDDDQSIRWVLEKALKQASMDVATFETADEALEALQQNALLPNAIITDIRMPGSDGLTFLARLKHIQPDIPVLVMTAFSDLNNTVTAFERGAFEYIPKPFDVDAVIDQTRRACESVKTPGLTSAKPTQQKFTELMGESDAMQVVFNAIGRLSRSKITVLINGESGSGKELIAQALHKHSPRADEPFIALNMAAIPHDLMESELFGHEKGAFTGAQSSRRGRFEQAHGGTLFLDEIGDMPAVLQTRLLRVLADGQFFRVGGHTPVTVDVRIVTATHQDLEKLVAEKKFREDLFHRLNVIRIHAPPLRERTEDIPLLLRSFLADAANELGVEPKRVTAEFEKHVCRLQWPGNVRQLQNTAHWLTVMAVGKTLEIDDLPNELQQEAPTSSHDWETNFENWVTQLLKDGESNILSQATPMMERILISCALKKTRNKRQEAARLLGWGRNTLTRKIKELGM